MHNARLASQTYTHNSLLPKSKFPEGQAEMFWATCSLRAQLLHQQTFAEHSLCVTLGSEGRVGTRYEPRVVCANGGVLRPGPPEPVVHWALAPHPVCLCLLGLYPG